jgi:hypothetical protein
MFGKTGNMTCLGNETEYVETHLSGTVSHSDAKERFGGTTRDETHLGD